MLSFPQGVRSHNKPNFLDVDNGTSDPARNTYLLPNLMGHSFDTMRYNGMGNRFRNNGRYHKLITAHGILAATIFLGLVPVSTMILRFYTFRPWMALRIHIWSQLLSLVLCTACIATGCIATGSKRSLTNPHHGIGLAVYILMYVNLVWGFAVHLRTRGKRFMHIPMSILGHQWIGRAWTLLGIIQVPLGLTLYGSSVTLFILYAIVMSIYLMVYFVFTYLQGRSLSDEQQYPPLRSSGIEEKGLPVSNSHGDIFGSGSPPIGLDAMLSNSANERISYSRDSERLGGSSLETAPIFETKGLRYNWLKEQQKSIPPVKVGSDQTPNRFKCHGQNNDVNGRSSKFRRREHNDNDEEIDGTIQGNSTDHGVDEGTTSSIRQVERKSDLDSPRPRRSTPIGSALLNKLRKLFKNKAHASLPKTEPESIIRSGHHQCGIEKDGIVSRRRRFHLTPGHGTPQKPLSYPPSLHRDDDKNDNNQEGELPTNYYSPQKCILSQKRDTESDGNARTAADYPINTAGLEKLVGHDGGTATPPRWSLSATEGTTKNPGSEMALEQPRAPEASGLQDKVMTTKRHSRGSRPEVLPQEPGSSQSSADCGNDSTEPIEMRPLGRHPGMKEKSSPSNTNHEKREKAKSKKQLPCPNK